MEKLEVIIKSTIILFIVIYLDLVVFGPIIEDAFELGLISLKDLPDPRVVSFWRILCLIIEIGGVYSIVFYVEDYIKNIM